MDGPRPATAAFLFCDLVGSTEAAVSGGEDAGDRLRWRCFSILRKAVVATGGTEVKTTGGDRDGLLVWFPSAVSALDCAVAMQQGMERGRQHGGGPLPGLRVGLSVGDAMYEADDWFGLPLVEASRLCDHATAGQILATAVTVAVAGRRGSHTAEPVGDLQLKGLDETTATTEIQWRTAALGAPPLPATLSHGQTPYFVSRDAEIDRLRAVHATVVAGESAMVLLSGEPGVGKTSLAADAAAWAHERGGAVLYGRCDEELAAAYQPFREALQGYLEVQPPDRVRELLTPWPQLARLAGTFAERAGVRPPPGNDPEGDRVTLFAGVEAWLAELAQSMPVLLVIDDLHWATAPTLQLLRHLAHQRWFSLLTIATFRDTDVVMDPGFTEMLAEVHRQPNVHRIALGGLDAVGVGALIEARAGHELPERGQELAERVHAGTGGNPFFVNEILRHLLESGVIVRRGARWEVTDVPATLDLPEGVRAVITRRLSRLSTVANDALRVAAAVGPTVPFALLSAVCEADTLLDALDEAVGAGIISEVGDAEYAFAHALVRQTVYGSMSAARRRRLHHLIATIIEALPTIVADANAALAYHVCEGAGPGDGRRAAEYSLAAGRDALAHSGHELAIDQFNRGLSILGRYGPPDSGVEADLYLGLAEGWYRMADHLSRRNAAWEAARAARASGSARRLGEAAFWMGRYGIVGTFDPRPVALCEEALGALDPAPSALRAKVMGVLASNSALAGEGVSADPLAASAVRMAREVGDVAAIAENLGVRCTTLTGGPHVGRRLAVASELIDVATRANDLTALANGHRFRAAARMALGDREGFDDDFAAMSRLGDTVRDGFLRALASQWRATVALMDGRFDELETYAKAPPEDRTLLTVWFAQVLQLRSEQGRFAEMLPMLEAVLADYPIVALRAALALGHAYAGHHDRAGSHLRDIIAGIPSAIPHDWNRCAALISCAETAAIIGDRRAAAWLEEELVPYTGQMVVVANGTDTPGAIDRYRGMVLAVMGDLDAALGCFVAALALEEGLRSPPNLARTHLWYGRALHQRGDRAGARAQATSAVAIAGRLGMSGVLRDASELLDA